MRREWLITTAAALAAAVPAGAAFAWWLSRPLSPVPAARVPGMDRPRGAAQAKPRERVRIGEGFARGPGKPGAGRFSWPCFRGPGRDNICRQGVRLAARWPADGPRVVWSRPLGEGYAGAVVRGGCVYLLDYDEAAEADTLLCLSLADGGLVWKRWYRVRVKRNHGRSRTVPAVDDKYVLTMGPRCHVMCVDRVTGALKWGLDLERDYGTTVPLWYTGQCPLIDEGVAVLAPAGTRHLLLGVDCASGRELWSTPNPHGWRMSHSSVMPMTIAGKHMYVYAAVGGICGVSAEPHERGRLLWESTAFQRSVIAPSPVHLGGGVIMITAGYGGGSMVLRVERRGEDFSARVLQRLKTGAGLASEQQTPIFWQGRVFAIQPKDAGATRLEFVCAEAGDLTRIAWTSGKDRRFGLGPYLLADGKFYLLTGAGELVMLRASTSGYEELARARVLSGHDAWAPLAIAGTRMLLRDSRTLKCIDLGADDEQPRP